MTIKSVTIYYDYLCSYAFRLSGLLESIKGDIPGGIDISWKTFSLEQQNINKGPDFRLWDCPEHPSLGMGALIAAKAAKNQGQALFSRFHFAVFKARHEDFKNISSREILEDIARTAGLNIDQLLLDMDKNETRQAVGRDHLYGKTKHNIFGVPTLTFDDADPVYVKLSVLPNSMEERLSLFEMIRQAAVKRPCLMEIKRPDPVML